MKERKLVRQFTLDTEIYDDELPQKVLSVLRAEPLETDPHFYYGMSIVFDKAVHQTRDFFNTPWRRCHPRLPGGTAERRNRISCVIGCQPFCANSSPECHPLSEIQELICPVEQSLGTIWNNPTR